MSSHNTNNRNITHTRAPLTLLFSNRNESPMMPPGSVITFFGGNIIRVSNKIPPQSRVRDSKPCKK